MHRAPAFFSMSRPDFTFKITHKVEVRVDLHRKLGVVSCETKDGKSIQIEADYQTLEKIHDEIRKQLETY